MKKNNSYKDKGCFLFIALLALLVMVIFYPIGLEAFSGLGGFYIAEKKLGDGVGDALQLGDSLNGPIVLSADAAPTIVTNSAINITNVSARIRLTLVSLGTAPNTTVSFDWYEDGQPPWGNSTAPVVKLAPGTQSNVIAGLTPGALHHFRSKATNIVGTNYGATLDFTTLLVAPVSGTPIVSSFILGTILPILIAVGLFIVVLRLRDKPIEAFVAAVVGLIIFYVVRFLF